MTTIKDMVKFLNNTKETNEGRYEIVNSFGRYSLFYINENNTRCCLLKKASYNKLNTFFNGMMVSYWKR